MDEVYDRLNELDATIYDLRVNAAVNSGRIGIVEDRVVELSNTWSLEERILALEHAMAARPWLEAEVDVVPYVMKDGAIRFCMLRKEPGEMPLETVMSPALEDYLRSFSRNREEYVHAD